MGDISRQGDLDVRIVDAACQFSARVVIDEDGENALKVSGNVNISGSSGSQFFLSIANKIYTAEVTSGASWTMVLDLTVPTGKVWYLKGIVASTERQAKYKLSLGPAGNIAVMQGIVDANDTAPIELYGFQQNEDDIIKFELNAEEAGHQLYGNIIMYEDVAP